MIDERQSRLSRLGLVVAVALTTRAAAAQTPVDSALLAYITSIRAVDAHAHPMRPVAVGAAADTEFDALPLDGIPPFAVPHRLTLDDPIWRSAQEALLHVPTAGNVKPGYFRPGALRPEMNERTATLVASIALMTSASVIGPDLNAAKTSSIAGAVSACCAATSADGESERSSARSARTRSTRAYA